jgi:hypothetical protein
MTKAHSFHIPVMGIGYTIDTPLKVSHLGIDSVISLVDDILIEKMRKMYCGIYNLPYEEITSKAEDFRAKRITSYLNLIGSLAEKKFEEFKSNIAAKKHEITEFFELLPDTSAIKQEFRELKAKYLNLSDMEEWLRENLSMGSIDVNIMTKVDKDNYVNGVQLPVEYNDAHAALRGYANSNLSSSIILSAGMNPRLYTYMQKFQDFYPDAKGYIKKKIVLKVSDFRSALIQGKFLAKKGLWVSEYRVESGLNCGGHAFATDGYLLGPILAEFRDKRSELSSLLNEIHIQALSEKNLTVPETPLSLKITAQGGVGTAEEHQFLIDHYKVDSVGWGTPFLLVPEVTTVDELTLKQLADAQEDDLYLSNISPLGVPFNNMRGNSKDVEKEALIVKGRPGSSCPKEFVSNNNEFTERYICTASRHYQYLKLNDLESQKLNGEYQKEYDKVVDKACICVGLGTSVLIANNLDTRTEGVGVSVCPGPNLAYFSKIMSLKELVDHIYGRLNVITRTDRPHMFIKELTIYIDYLKNKIEEAGVSISEKQAKYHSAFIKNLEDGIEYYSNLFHEFRDRFESAGSGITKALDESKKTLNKMIAELKKEIELDYKNS